MAPHNPTTQKKRRYKLSLESNYAKSTLKDNVGRAQMTDFLEENAEYMEHPIADLKNNSDLADEVHAVWRNWRKEETQKARDAKQMQQDHAHKELQRTATRTRAQKSSTRGETRQGQAPHDQSREARAQEAYLYNVDDKPQASRSGKQQKHTPEASDPTHSSQRTSTNCPTQPAPSMEPATDTEPPCIARVRRYLQPIIQSLRDKTPLGQNTFLNNEADELADLNILSLLSRLVDLDIMLCAYFVMTVEMIGHEPEDVQNEYNSLREVLAQELVNRIEWDEGLEKEKEASRLAQKLFPMESFV